VTKRTRCSRVNRLCCRPSRPPADGGNSSSCPATARLAAKRLYMDPAAPEQGPVPRRRSCRPPCPRSATPCPPACHPRCRVQIFWLADILAELSKQQCFRSAWQFGLEIVHARAPSWGSQLKLKSRCGLGGSAVFQATETRWPKPGTMRDAASELRRLYQHVLTAERVVNQRDCSKWTGANVSTLGEPPSVNSRVNSSRAVSGPLATVCRASPWGGIPHNQGSVGWDEIST
jgi:hypothetical protein